MKREWTVREARPDDVESINRLFETTMGMTRSLAHDRWKFWENFAGAPYIMLAEAAGEVVGQYALWPTPLRLGTEEVRGAQSLDTMTHPAFQGQGMFTTLAVACFELAASRGCEALYGFPNANSYPGFVRRLNWDHTGDVPAWTRPLRPSRHPRIPSALGPVADVTAAAFPAGRPRGHRVDAGRPDDAQIEALLAADRADKNACRVSRTPAWYTWRFAPAGGHDYEWLAARAGDDEVVGWAIWGKDPLAPFPRALVSDLVARDAAAAEALCHAVVTRAKAAGHAVLGAVTNVPTAVAGLRRCGFVNHTKIPLIVRGLTARNLGANIHDHASWRVFGADLDTF